MTEELVEKMISVFAGLKTDLYGIKVALVLISISLAFGVSVFVAKVWKDN